jgi:hypothetical protein
MGEERNEFLAIYQRITDCSGRLSLSPLVSRPVNLTV